MRRLCSKRLVQVEEVVLLLSTKRKNSEIQPPPPVSAPPIIRKRTWSSTNNGQARSVDSDMGDDDDDDADGDSDLGKLAPLPSMNGETKKPETKEKRKNFLEQNRQAALKCRQRKKEWLQKLQANVEKLTTENGRLTSAFVA
ncbi:Transcription factor [Marasmius crinis-equi]|uniref:Transcription factor n=1 Tax=Marasmius crinis-equi TaxID=585013 RepID=A0ABR3F322_9AGAR